MEMYFTSQNDSCQTIIFVYNKDDLPSVITALDIISKLLFVNLDYYVDFVNNEIHVPVEDYDEFKTLQRKIFDHCNVA